jgi:hypothetical protein
MKSVSFGRRDTSRNWSLSSTPEVVTSSACSLNQFQVPKQVTVSLPSEILLEVFCILWMSLNINETLEVGEIANIT